MLEEVCTDCVDFFLVYFFFFSFKCSTADEDQSKPPRPRVIEKVVAAVREDHLAFVVDVPAGGVAAGARRLVDVVIDTRTSDIVSAVSSFEATAATASSATGSTGSTATTTAGLAACQDVRFWGSDHLTPLAHWLEPGRCPSIKTPFVVSLPGPLPVGPTTLYLSHGAGAAALAGTGAARMNGTAVFALSDGLSTWATPYMNTVAWVYPVSQQYEDGHRFKQLYASRKNIATQVGAH